jgi:hypothetical protein
MSSPTLSPRDNIPDTPYSVRSFKYKKVENKIRPVATTLPEQYRIQRQIPSDPLADLPTLPTDPPPFTPGNRYTKERMEALNLDRDRFLWPKEIDLANFVISTHEKGFAWTDLKRGAFRDDYFPPIVFPTIEHVPWALQNIPIPPGIRDRVIQIIKDKMAAGVYESSNSSYRS